MPLTIEKSYLRNFSNVVIPTVGSVNGCWMPNKLVVISNTRVDAAPGQSLASEFGQIGIVRRRAAFGVLHQSACNKRDPIDPLGMVWPVAHAVSPRW